MKRTPQFYIKVLVSIDFLAVSLVVPLLSSYFRDAGADTKQYGLIMSLYSISQLVGGTVMGFLSDHISKRDVLLISFLGSGISYFMVGTCTSVNLLLYSRVLVGLVKQTMSISTAAIAELVPSADMRAQDLGHISAIATSAFIVGPSMGSLLYAQHRSLPALVAASCFVVNMFICTYLMPQNMVLSRRSGHELKAVKAEQRERESSPNSLQGRIASIRERMATLSKFPNFWPVLFSRVLVSFVESSMSSRNVINYYESKFSLQTTHLGYLSSVTTFLSVAVQTLGIRYVFRTCQGENATKALSHIMVVTLVIMALASTAEHFITNFKVYCATSLAPQVVASTLLEAALRSAFTDVVPTAHIGKALGLLGVVSSGLQVVSPLYGAYVFSSMGGWRSKAAIAAGHNFITAAAVFVMFNFFVSTAVPFGDKGVENGSGDVMSLAPSNETDKEGTKIKQKDNVEGGGESEGGGEGEHVQSGVRAMDLSGEDRGGIEAECQGGLGEVSSDEWASSADDTWRDAGSDTSTNVLTKQKLL